MNNNRNNNNNNRRRGRGNNNRPQGGQQLNRIDSRARGNAPQLLEKYRKLAHDSHLNGDRVTEEYYLQFADHYFRVLADQRQRQEEQRQPRPNDRPAELSDEDGEDDFYADSNSPYERAGSAYTGNGNGNGQHRDGYREVQGRDQRDGQNGSSNGGNGQSGEDRQDRGRRAERSERPERRERPARAERFAAPAEGTPNAEPQQSEVAPEAADGTLFEPTENPFVRESRAPRTPRPRAPRRARGSEDAGENIGNVAQDAASAAEPAHNFDPAILPPAISAGREEVADEAPAKPKRRTRRAAPPSDDAAGALEKVN